MEIKIINPGEEFVKAIDWNYAEIKEELEDKMAMYGQMVYDENQIKEAKADRAELNKFKTAIEDKRKEIKKTCLAPYEAFEKQVKELVAIIDKPIALIDSQVKAFEEEQKQAKEKEIREYFDTKDFNGFTYEQIADSKWLNASVSMKSVKDAIDEKASNIAADMQILNDIQEYSFEAIQMYKQTMDVRIALNEARRLSEMAKQKAEYEKAQAEAKAKAEQEAVVNEAVEVPGELPVEEIAEDYTPFADDYTPDFSEIQTTREWTVVKMLLSDDEKNELAAFLNARSIEYSVM